MNAWVECMCLPGFGPVAITHDRFGGTMVWPLSEAVVFGDLELLMEIHQNIAAQQRGIN